MLNFFGGKAKSGSGANSQRVTRHSIGWGRLLERMRAEESLRVLDVGPTSSSNINFITALGHSIYLANLVEDTAKREWTVPGQDGAPPRLDVERFLASHLDFSGRGFDVVTFWDTADYLPEELLQPVLDKLFEVMAPGGQMLALFHTAATGPNTGFNRYHLTEKEEVEVQRSGEYPLLHVYNNRQIEKMFAAYKDFHFFLGKDNVREVLITR